jgi:uncharacterized Zn-finger protein
MMHPPRPDRKRPVTEPEMPIPAPETEVINVWKIACDGGEGALGHPRVWLAVPHDTGVVECGYCDKKYVHENFIEKLKG